MAAVVGSFRGWATRARSEGDASAKFDAGVALEHQKHHAVQELRKIPNLKRGKQIAYLIDSALSIWLHYLSSYFWLKICGLDDTTGLAMTPAARDDRSASSSDSEDVDEPEVATMEQRARVARALTELRHKDVQALHTTKSRHYVDNFFSFVTGNMAVVCWVLSVMYRLRSCHKPLAAYLAIQGVLSMCAALLPILVRQWVYLHLRLNWTSAAILLGSGLHVAWLFVGQSWAFGCSPAVCDEELCTAANSSVFVLYVALLFYAGKVVWYLAFRVRYRYRDLCTSCLRDPYPNALHLDNDEVLRLHDIVICSTDSEPQPTPSKPVKAAAARASQYRKQGRR